MGIVQCMTSLWRRKAENSFLERFYLPDKDTYSFLGAALLVQERESCTNKYSIIFQVDGWQMMTHDHDDELGQLLGHPLVLSSLCNFINLLIGKYMGVPWALLIRYWMALLTHDPVSVAEKWCYLSYSGVTRAWSFHLTWTECNWIRPSCFLRFTHLVQGYRQNTSLLML